jgi:drug/metabolite transporter (DMT)-like permease
MPEQPEPAREPRPNDRPRGLLLACATAAISGVAIWLNGLAVKQLPDAILFTTLKNTVALAVLLAIALPRSRFSDMRRLGRRELAALGVVGLLGGGLGFLLFFNGLALASAPSAAFIHKTLFVWVAVLAVPLLGERLGPIQVAALGLLVLGQAIVLPPAGMAWGPGETLILAATACWAIEVVLVRRFLRGLPAALLGACRLGIGLPVLLATLAWNGGLSTGQLTPSAWAWIALTGCVLAGYVATWYAALRRAPASEVTSILVAGAVVTGVLQAISKGAPPAPDIATGYLLILAALAGLVAATRLPMRGASPALAASRAGSDRS